MNRLAAAVVAIALAAAPSRADRAAHLAAARDARAALRFDAALAEVEAALADGGASPADTAAMYRLAGELAAGLDRPAEATAWFARWLAVVPDGALDADASPKLTGAVTAARARATALRLSARRAGDAVVATISGGGDLARGVRVVADLAAPAGAGVDGVVGQALPWPRGQAAVVIALDRHGNHLAYATVDAPAVRASVPLYRRWVPYAGAAVVAGAVGGIAAWRTSVAEADWDALRADPQPHAFAEYEAVRARGDRAALIADVAFAVTGVATVAAVIAWRTTPRGGEVTVAPTAGGATVGYAGRF